jgi:hypothetical protein
MANVTVSISTAKLQYAIAFIEGMKTQTPKVTDAVVDKALTDLGYTPIEIYLIRSTKATEIVEAVFNPPIHHRAKANRKPKAIIETTFVDDDTIEDCENGSIDTLGI